MYQNTFNDDLKFGQVYELLALKYIHYDSYTQPRGYYPGFDIETYKNGIRTRYEVKSDTVSWDFGSILIEYANGYKKSGIQTSQSDHYIYFLINPRIPEEFRVFIIPTTELKKLCQRSDVKTIECGHRKKSKCYLINLTDIRFYEVWTI